MKITVLSLKGKDFSYSTTYAVGSRVYYSITNPNGMLELIDYGRIDEQHQEAYSSWNTQIDLQMDVSDLPVIDANRLAGIMYDIDHAYLQTDIDSSNEFYRMAKLYSERIQSVVYNDVRIFAVKKHFSYMSGSANDTFAATRKLYLVIKYGGDISDIDCLSLSYDYDWRKLGDDCYLVSIYDAAVWYGEKGLSKKYLDLLANELEAYMPKETLAIIQMSPSQKKNDLLEARLYSRLQELEVKQREYFMNLWKGVSNSLKIQQYGNAIIRLIYRTYQTGEHGYKFRELKSLDAKLPHTLCGVFCKEFKNGQ